MDNLQGEQHTLLLKDLLRHFLSSAYFLIQLLTIATENFQSLVQHPAVAYFYSSTRDRVLSQLTFLRAAYIEPYIIEPLSTFLITSTAVPDIFTIFLLVLILYISLRVLDYARRVVMFWLMLGLRLVFWGSLLGYLLYGYQQGFANIGRDVGWLFGVVSGLFQEFQKWAAAAATDGAPKAGKAGFGGW